MKFPTILYKCPGMHQRPGGTYSYIAAPDEETAKSLMSEGWHGALPDAIKPPKEVKVAPKLDAPPTRDELMTKAKAMGIKFKGNVSNKELLAEITNVLSK